MEDILSKHREKTNAIVRRLAVATAGEESLASLGALLMMVAVVHAEAGEFPSKELLHKTLDGFIEAEKNFRAKTG